MFDSFRKKFSLSKIEKKLREDLQEAKFSKNWGEIQRLNLKLLWIDFVKREGEIMSKGFGLPRGTVLDRNIRDNEGAYFPESFDPNDPLQDKFAEKIVRDFGGVMGNPGKYEKCLYKPISQLPYPKEYISRACQHLCKQLESDNPSWEKPEGVEDFVRNIRAIEVFLPNFINVPEADLPTDTRENLEVGSSLVNE